MFHRHLAKCHRPISGGAQQLGQIGSRAVNFVLFARCKSRFKGKKQQNFEKITYEDKNVPETETTDFEEGEFLPRRLSYMPEGLPQHRGKKIKWWLPDRTPIEVDVSPPEPGPEWVDKPNYPPIVEMSTGFLRRTSEERENRLKFYRSLDRLATFDQKQFELTNLKPILSTRFSSVSPAYDYLPLYSYVTRTHQIDDRLPAAYEEPADSLLSELVTKVKPQIFNAIRNSMQFDTARQSFEVPMFRRAGEDIPRFKRHEALIQNIHDICMKQLLADSGANCGHLSDSIVEFNPEVQSWWWGSQFVPGKNVKTFQIAKVEQINLSCQYHDYAVLNVRMNEPLEPVLDQSDPLVNRIDVPRFPTHPFKLGYGEKFLYVANLPGFLPSLENDNQLIRTAKRGDFPYLTYLNRALIDVRKAAQIDPFNDDRDVLKAMALIHNFAYLNSLAAVHGFHTYAELSYPLSNQCIITDGQSWSFFVYQMNAHTFHSDVPSSDKQNLCWSLNDLQLYESYEDGQFKGVNDRVIELLIRCYLQRPRRLSEEAIAELRPHLHEDLRSPEERVAVREDLKRRFAQYKTQREKFAMLSRIVYPFEWLHVRNPKSNEKFLRLLRKRRELYGKNGDTWPKDQLQPIAHKFSNQESRK